MNIDYEAEYNNRDRVPEHPGVIQGWVRDAAAYRETNPPAQLRYSEGERHLIDVFGDGDGPLVMFIHGGYWQATDRTAYSHLARGLNLLGVRVALPSYDLCPNVRLGDIVEQMRQASAALAQAHAQPIVVAGHSAGGHLAACLLATEAHVPAGYAISGLFELAPLIPTSYNAALRLGAGEAEALSPLFWPAPVGKTFDAVVGEAESGEFHRQSRAIVEQWGEDGVTTAYGVIPGANHFTVIAPLADPASAMCARLRAMAEAAR